MKNRFIIAAIFSIFLLIPSNVQAASYTDNQTVDSNKTWTIKFTSEVGLDDLTMQGITVKDSLGDFPIELQLGQDNKTIIVTAPYGGYIPGENYTLYVGNSVHSSKNKPLKNIYKLHFTIKSNDSVITFKDNFLKQAVRQDINKPTGDIYKSDVEKLSELTVWSREIKDISGVEDLINLKILDLDENQISDINAVNGITSLQYLGLTSNQIKDISALKYLNNLNTITLERNQISDISPLKGMTKLERLYLSNNEITDISALQGLTNLKFLRLDFNQIKDINALKGLTNLQELRLGGNQISDADIQLLKNALPNCWITGL